MTYVEYLINMIENIDNKGEYYHDPEGDNILVIYTHKHPKTIIELHEHDLQIEIDPCNDSSSRNAYIASEDVTEDEFFNLLMEHDIPFNYQEFQKLTTYIVKNDIKICIRIEETLHNYMMNSIKD